MSPNQKIADLDVGAKLSSLREMSTSLVKDLTL